MSVSLVLFVVVAIYLNVDRDPGTKVRFKSSSYMEDVTITQKREGQLKWRLNAQKAFFLNTSDVKLAGLQIEFPEKGLTLTSESGMYDIEKRNLKIDGPVNASTKDYDIRATALFWDSSKNEITSNEKVTIVGKRFTVEGDSLAATSDKAMLRNNVKAVFNKE